MIRYNLKFVIGLYDPDHATWAYVQFCTNLICVYQFPMKVKTKNSIALSRFASFQKLIRWLLSSFRK